jgi:hypothetical protein
MLKSFEDWKNFISAVLQQLADAAPGLKQNYYVGGRTPISCLDLQHAISFDLDLHTKTEKPRPARKPSNPPSQTVSAKSPRSHRFP